MARPENWPLLLDGYLKQARRTAFVWGSHDCLTYACGWHQVLTGRDVFAAWRGRYDSETAARRLIVDAEAQDMIDVGRILFGKPLANGVRLAKRGDIALVRKSFGIVCGREAAFAGEAGQIFLRAAEFEQAWAI